MKPRPRIYKGPDGWTVQLPAFGLCPDPQTRTGFASREQAGQWLARQQNIGSGAQHVERTATPEDSDLRYGARWPIVIR